MRMDIRVLTTADAAAYRVLRQRGLREHPDAFTSDADEDERKPMAWYEQRLAGAGLRFWGAFLGDQLVGAVGLERDKRVKTRHKATLIAMYVATEAAGQGIGRQLMEALLAQARADGLALIVLTVTEGNGPARRVYERAGFRSFGIEPDAIRVEGRPFAKNHMYLELSPS